MKNIFTNATAALNESTTFFETTGPGRLTCDGLDYDQEMTVLVEKASGGYHPMTCEGKTVVLKKMNNTIFLPGPGAYAIDKPYTANGVSAGFTE